MRCSFESGVEDRFREKYEETSDGCWEWQAYTLDSGYGKFYLEGESQYAHRVAYRMFCGPISDEAQINHHCDNPSCVRPDHLYEGTQKENVADSIERGNFTKHRSLDESSVKEIRQICASTDRVYESIADEYGVSVPTISKIANKETWSWVNSPDE